MSKYDDMPDKFYVNNNRLVIIPLKKDENGYSIEENGEDRVVLISKDYKRLYIITDDEIIDNIPDEDDLVFNFNTSPYAEMYLKERFGEKIYNNKMPLPLTASDIEDFENKIPQYDQKFFEEKNIFKRAFEEKREQEEKF